MYTVYVCEDHGCMLKKCCTKAEDIGWMATAEDYESSQNK